MGRNRIRSRDVIIMAAMFIGGLGMGFAFGVAFAFDFVSNQIIKVFHDPFLAQAVMKYIGIVQ